MARHLLLGLAASLAVALIGGSAANAEVLQFNLSGGKTASFLFDTSSAPSFSSSSDFFGEQLQYSSLSGEFNGVTQVAPSIGFATGPFFSDFQITGSKDANGVVQFIQYSGPALFTGKSSSPSFLTGTFQLSSIVSGASQLVISEASVSAAPEPAAWSLMFAGVGLAGLALRRRRNQSGAILAT